MNAPRGPRGWTLAEDAPPLSYRGDWPADRVPPDDGCTCGERRVDWLMWCGPDGSPFVECQSCGREFIPGEVAR